MKIPKANIDISNYPCWVPIEHSTNNAEWYEAKLKGDEIEQLFEESKPIVRCKCGAFLGIKNHHLHIDGTLTASFYHREDPEGGCGFHEHLVFENYNGREWPPQKD